MTDSSKAHGRTLAGMCFCGAVHFHPSCHIFVGSKGPWFTITDDLPQHEGHVVVAAPSR